MPVEITAPVCRGVSGIGGPERVSPLESAWDAEPVASNSCGATASLPRSAPPGSGGDAAVLPTFSPYQSQPGQYIEVFNRGQDHFDYTITSAEPWLRVSPRRGTVDTQVRATVRVDGDGTRVARRLRLAPGSSRLTVLAFAAPVPEEGGGRKRAFLEHGGV